MTSLNRDVRFTPETGHRNRHAYHPRRTNSGSFAIFAAIRRASSSISNLAATLRAPRAAPCAIFWSLLVLAVIFPPSLTVSPRSHGPDSPLSNLKNAARRIERDGEG